jgi:N6-L-threonylcarbamoyladenine synthase
MKMNSNPNILAIESSCDDTSAAVWKNFEIKSNVICNQEIHKLYGGVVPELASRDHIKNIVPVVTEALKIANIDLLELDAIAVTTSPGLIGSLLVGSSFAKSIALALDIPFISVNHMEAHVMANFIDSPKPSFPFLCLTVSGGHTQIVKVISYLEQEILGETTDDAAGEAFDKTAKILGLPYPGGPLIDKYAKLGNPLAYSFPEPKIPGLDFSFSGLKTAILNFVNNNQNKNPDFLERNLNDICAAVQFRIVSILLNKLEMAAKQTGITEVALAGGVSANSSLRDMATNLAIKNNWNLYIPHISYCTDNAAMIAITGYHKYLNNQFANLTESTSAKTHA